MRTHSVFALAFSVLIIGIGPIHGQETSLPEPLQDDDDASSSTLNQPDSQTSQTLVEEITFEERTRFLELDERTIHQFSNMDLAEYLQLRTKATRAAPQQPHPREEAGRAARRTLGQPFRLNAVQFDPAEGDCVSCVNRQLALSLAWDWQSYVILVERIRHKDGIVEYKNRNFFTLQDWLPNNTAWLLDDITGDIGPAMDPPAKRFTYPVRPKLFDERPAAPGSKFVRITFKGWDRSSGRTEIWPSLYVPTERIHDVLPDLTDGDVVLVLREAPEGHLDCDHMGMIVRDGDLVELAHSVPPDAIREPLMSFLGRCHWIVGLKFLRLRENAREIAEHEVARLASSVAIPTPAAQDAKNAKLRAQRLGTSGQQ